MNAVRVTAELKLELGEIEIFFQKPEQRPRMPQFLFSDPGHGGKIRQLAAVQHAVDVPVAQYPVAVGDAQQFCLEQGLYLVIQLHFFLSAGAALFGQALLPLQPAETALTVLTLEQHFRDAGAVRTDHPGVRGFTPRAQDFTIRSFHRGAVVAGMLVRWDGHDNQAMPMLPRLTGDRQATNDSEGATHNSTHCRSEYMKRARATARSWLGAWILPICDRGRSS